MRALTVRQPWAWALIHGGKDVENRTRNLAGSYRGPVAIHAGLTPDLPAMGDPQIRAAALKVDRELPAVYRFNGIDHWHKETLRLGAFIGVADLVDVHLPWACSRPTGGLCSWWAQPMVHHLVLANPRPLPEPIPARGMLGLWTPPAEVLDQLQAVTR